MDFRYSREVIVGAIVTIAVLDFFLSLAIWGTTTTVRVAG